MRALIIFALAASSCAPTPSGSNVSVVDLSKPAVHVENQAVSLGFHQDDKASALVFLSTTCPVANRYIPELKSIMAHYAPLGVRFAVVYPDPDDAEQTILSHQEEYSFKAQIIEDPHHRVVALTGVSVTPEVAVFDAEGKLRYRGRVDNRVVDFGKQRPEPTKRDLREALEAILSGTAIEEPRTEAVGCYLSDMK